VVITDLSTNSFSTKLGRLSNDAIGGAGPFENSTFSNAATWLIFLLEPGRLILVTLLSA
jgi:hypothetical protein